MKLENQNFFASPPFPDSLPSIWNPFWEELKAAGYELHSDAQILDNASYPDDPDASGLSYSIKKDDDFTGTFKDAIIHYFGEQEAALIFSEWQLAADCLELPRLEAWISGARKCVNTNFDIKAQWKSGTFLEAGCRPLVAKLQEYPHLEWVGYESYMEAQLLKAVPGEIGVLLVKFPLDAAEDNEVHVHPCSDRIITVISGSGEFVRYWNGKVETFPLVPGDRVWMPRGILHTFRSGEEGLLVESLHNPFLSFNHPKCLLYPKKQIEV